MAPVMPVKENDMEEDVLSPDERWILPLILVGALIGCLIIRFL